MDVEALLERLREEIRVRGTGWLERQLGGAAGAGAEETPSGPSRVSGRRSRAPARLSPEVIPRSRRRRESPLRDPPAGPAAGSPSAGGRSAGRNLRDAVRAAVATRAGPGGPARRRRGEAELLAAGPSADAPSAGRARRSGRTHGVSPAAHRGALRGAAAAGGSCGLSGTYAAASMEEEGRRRLMTSSDVEERRLSRGELEAGSAPRMLQGLEDVSDSEGEEEDASPALEDCRAADCGQDNLRPVVASVVVPPAAARAGGAVAQSERGGGRGGAAGRRGQGGSTAAGQSAPERLGECTTISGVGGGGEGLWEGLSALLRDVRVLLQDRAPPAAGSPAAVWAAGAPGGSGVPVGPAEVGSAPAPVAAPAAKSGEKGVEEVRLADSAKGEVYVCFEGPLGAHLKTEVRERIWKGEYVEIFSLLPLEKFNLDRVKPDESKKEEEERRRYRLIPRTFANWMQAFAILASVIGEKAPENCSGLFCYLDSVGEAYRVYGGTAWLRYDEQFRQRKAVRPSLRWDHKDISLWMKLMAAPRTPGGQQSFRDGAGGSGAGSGRPAGAAKGCCWQFNEGQCRFGDSCRFRHECSGCGGAHSLARCFKKGKGKGGDSEGKGGHSGESGAHAAVSRAVPK